MDHNRTTTVPTNERSERSRRWCWPPYPTTFVAVGSILVVAFLANFPAYHATVPGFHSGKYGRHFELEDEFQHGWPARYVRRDSFREVDSPVGGVDWESTLPWTPWVEPIEFHLSALLLNIGVWLGALLAVGLLVQLWRSRRRALWQFRLVDVLGLITVLAVIGAWYRNHRIELNAERILAKKAMQQGEIDPYELGGSVPAWLPAEWEQRYRQAFGRVYYFSGEAGVACQFSHLRVLQPDHVGHEFGELLRRMPQLEALDFMMVGFQTAPEEQPFTLMRDLPPMPNLRGINLYDTDVTDADLVWLSKCPQLECIELTPETDISDVGLRHLARLQKLRILEVWSPLVTDEGCRMIASISSIEELYLRCEVVTDAGVLQLGRLKNLRVLHLETSASKKALDRLSKELPQCEFYP